MFELKYKITDADFKAVNKRIFLQYFIPYVIVALMGIGAGITAIALRPKTELFALGIILIVLAGILLACAVFMAIAPKNFVVSALNTDDNIERTLEIGESAVTIKTPDKSDITVRYSEILRIKIKKDYALLYVDKGSAVLVKDAIVSGGSFTELCELLKSKTVNAPVEAAPVETTPTAEEGKPEATTEPEQNEEAGEAEETSAE
ncbi:MAG: YcxB family protein [Clostridiales bacterium]|nr:YcxB family protein [Clostridiales bacterium]